MLASLRPLILNVLVLLALTLPAAAKTFETAELLDAETKLEQTLTDDAGDAVKPMGALKKEADAALKRRDIKGASEILTQTIALAPDDGANWLRYARTLLQLPNEEREDNSERIERAKTAAFAAYQRFQAPKDEAEALGVFSTAAAKQQDWRPALDSLRIALELREDAGLRAAYANMRDEHGFRITDYTIDSDASSPRTCFQFSEELPVKRTDFSPFVAVEGQDKPAIEAEGQQLCVAGLDHGQTYKITLRQGLPSMVHEDLTKTANYTVYVRDRKPAVRFSGRAYVLPRTGQQGIPLVSVNTSKVRAQIFRIGDRSITDAVLGGDFQRNLEGYEVQRLGEEKGQMIWTGEVDVERELNKEITTAFPIDEAIGDLEPGVYVITATPGDLPVEEYAARATQWFIVSDLGLTAFSGPDGIHAFVHSLASADAKGGVSVKLLARNNEVLAEKETDEAGLVAFEAGLARGEGGLAPAMLVASDGSKDYAFLNLTAAAFDLTDRGVGGRSSPAGLDAFVYPERGVYRTGEVVHLTALLRDDKARAVENASLTLVIQRPDGVEYRRALLDDQGLGGRSLDLPILSAAPTGTWRVEAYSDPKRAAIGAATFLVEDYVPDRLDFTLASKARSLSPSGTAEVTLEGRYLYGAPAVGLAIEGEVNVAPVSTLADFGGFTFGLDDDDATPTTQALEDLPMTGVKGELEFPVKLEKLPVTTRPLEARVVVRMAEAGGRAIERKLTLPVEIKAPMIGVKPLFSGKALGDGETAKFDIVVVGPDGKRMAQPGLSYELVRVEQHYQWYRQNGAWQFEPVKLTSKIADGKVDVPADPSGSLEFPVNFGRYRLELKNADANGPATSIIFESGWRAEASADTPDFLEIALDKPEYKPGGMLTVALTAPVAGKASISIVSDRLITTVVKDVDKGTAQIPLQVGDDWGPGAYVVATLRRPLDAEAKRMPGRAIGVQWFAIDRDARKLSVDLSLPELARPNETLRVPVKVGGLAAGELARLTVAAVDVGILNLTAYKSPSPDEYYLGQRRLSTELRDLYGQLIDGMQGNRGQIRTGGDGGAGALEGSPPTQAPMALYSGIVTVDENGAAEVTFDIPAFAGAARLMAVAWSKDRVGRADKDLIIRDPVVVTATLPRFLLRGDRSTVRLDIDNVEGKGGDYEVALAADGPLTLEGKTEQTLAIEPKARTAITLPITASGGGDGHVILHVTGPDQFSLDRIFPLTVKPSDQILARRTVTPLAKGESITLSTELFSDLVPGTGQLALSVSPTASLDAAALLEALDRYPYGCSEQITSRAIALLYVNDLSSSAKLALDQDADQRIKDALALLMTRQTSSGSFGIWSASGGDDLWLDAYVSDFLTRAKERGFDVPEQPFQLAMQRLQNVVANSPEPSEDGGRGLAYALYVLARNGAAPVGDLRYLADSKLDDIATPIAKAQIAAALGMLGDKTRSERVYAAALEALIPGVNPDTGRSDYGSALRDAAALVTLAAEGDAALATIGGAFARIEIARQATAATSTQENAWLVLAAHALDKQQQAVSIDVGAAGHRGPLYQSLTAEDFKDGALKVTNTGDAALQASVTVSGAPLTPEPAGESGFKIEREYYTLEGDAADPAKAKQNQRFVVLLRVIDPKPRFSRVLLTDGVPAGFEIDNPRLVSSGDTGALDWIENGAEPAHTEFRDDKFVAAFDRTAESDAIFTVAYVVRAVSPGKYVLPQAKVEDMYRPDRFARTATSTVEVQAAK